MVRLTIREDINGKKQTLSDIARMRGGESTHAKIFWPFLYSIEKKWVKIFTFAHSQGRRG